MVSSTFEVSRDAAVQSIQYRNRLQNDSPYIETFEERLVQHSCSGNGYFSWHYSLVLSGGSNPVGILFYF